MLRNDNRDFIFFPLSVPIIVPLLLFLPCPSRLLGAAAACSWFATVMISCPIFCLWVGEIFSFFLSLSATLAYHILSTPIRHFFLPLPSHIYKKLQVTPKQSFIHHTTGQLWNTLPSSIFPPNYDLRSFKGNVSRLVERNWTWLWTSHTVSSFHRWVWTMGDLLALRPDLSQRRKNKQTNK